MTGASFGERIWYESSVPVYLEKYLLPILATITTGIVLLNPMKFDIPSRIALFIAISAFAFLISHQLHLRNETIRTGTAPKTAEASTMQPPTIEQTATDSTCSNFVAGKDSKIDCSQGTEIKGATKSANEKP
jgi:hypothetical protein